MNASAMPKPAAIESAQFSNFGPDVLLPKYLPDTDQQLSRFQIHSYVASTDPKGLSIAEVKADDTIRVVSLMGYCSFATKNRAIEASIVGLVNAATADGIEYYSRDQADKIQREISEQAKKMQEDLIKYKPYKRRDGYGMDPKSGNYAAHEGGIIVCMPRAAGSIHASKDMQIDSECKDRGRLPAFYKNVWEKGGWFPHQKGRMHATARVDGVINVLAYDQKFEDNFGTYEVVVEITRKV